MNTTEIGNRTEGVVLGALLRAGMKVLVPFGGGLRYDLVFDRGGNLHRTQCKTGVYRKGCVVFNACSSQRDTKVRTHYLEDADFFGVYCPDIEKVYLVPVTDVPQSEGRLRVDPPRNGQAKGIVWAAPYEI